MTAPIIPEAAIQAAVDAVELPVRGSAGMRLALTAALPFLTGWKVKDLEWSKGVVDIAQPHPGMKYVACSTTPKGSWAFWLNDAPETRAVFASEEAAKAAAQADYEARIRSAIEVSAPDMGNPITDKTVKRRIADALEYVWSAIDCDVEHIESIIAHMHGNGLQVIESQQYRQMMEVIQQASAYLALSQPNSAEKLIADLDAAISGIGNHEGHSEPSPRAQALDSAVVNFAKNLLCSLDPENDLDNPEKFIAWHNLDAAIRALSANSAPSGWRDIATAPKDGTEIIYLTRRGVIGYCRYSPAVFDEDDSCWWDFQNDEEAIPAHWMPRSSLPSAPEGGE